MQPNLNKTNAMTQHTLSSSVLEKDNSQVLKIGGHQIERSVFRMSEDRIYTLLSINKQSLACSIDHGVNSKVTKRRFNMKEIVQIITSNANCAKERFKLNEGRLNTSEHSVAFIFKN